MKSHTDLTPVTLKIPGTIAETDATTARWFKLAEPDIYTTGKVTGGAAYDTKARLYEFLVSTKWYNRFFWGTVPEDYSNFAKRALEETNGAIIDVGCGGLTHTGEVYSSVNSELVLVDNSIEMLRIARKRILEHENKVPDNMLLLQADAFNLPFREQFDTLFSFGMLHLFDDKSAYLDSIFSAIRHGGSFYISCLSADRKISKKYIGILHKNKEMGEGLTSTQILELFKKRVKKCSSYCVGSMVFISGIK